MTERGCDGCFVTGQNAAIGNVITRLVDPKNIHRLVAAINELQAWPFDGGGLCEQGFGKDQECEE